MINALDLATRIKARVLQTSTSEVYGDPLEHPQKETYNGNVPITGIRHVTMKVRDVLKHYAWIIIGNLVQILRL